jgi:hypothetical protein
MLPQLYSNYTFLKIWPKNDLYCVTDKNLSLCTDKGVLGLEGRFAHESSNFGSRNGKTSKAYYGQDA